MSNPPEHPQFRKICGTGKIPPPLPKPTFIQMGNGDLIDISDKQFAPIDMPMIVDELIKFPASIRKCFQLNPKFLIKL